MRVLVHQPSLRCNNAVQRIEIRTLVVFRYFFVYMMQKIH